MLHLVAAVSALLTASAPELAHQARVEHAGIAYDVSYSPHLTTTAKTIGAAAGTRFSQQRCRWTVAVKVERAIRYPAPGAPVAKILPDERTLSGEAMGNCQQNRRAIQIAQASRQDDIRQIVLAAADADRGMIVADIDAARAFASN